MHWLNLEYLSAESWVARHHRLPSPVMSGPARGLIKHFFYPGFTTDTGGLMHRDRPEAPSDTNAPPLALDFGVFSYAQPQLGRWMRDWTRCAQAAGLPLRWRLAPGWPQQQVPAQAGRIEHQPFLSQSAFDAALLRPARTWGVNAVRGEDSWVGGLLSGQPVLWQAYPQADGASLDKLEAFLDLYLAQADPEWAQWVRAWHRLWNALPTDAPTEPPAIAPPTLAHLRSWQAHAQSVAQVLRRGPDLAEEILSAMRI
jgi:uncharacterized repeat protein (TIGR03837 family)